MSYGVIALNSHLNARNAGIIGNEEIDWAPFIEWNAGNGPDFAGRYFLGEPYLWSHGEGTEGRGQARSEAGKGLERIAPIQRFNPARQNDTVDGEKFAREDALAVCSHLQGCLNADELSIPKEYIYVFLEVPDNTKITAAYWAIWSSTIYDFTSTIVTEQTIEGIKLPKVSITQPFLPCIFCKFTENPLSKYSPEAGVTDCLNEVYRSYPTLQTRCFGFWARVAEKTEYYIPEPDLDWTLFASYEQPQSAASQAVPVVLWCYKDLSSSSPPDIPQGEKLSLAATPDTTGDDHVFNCMLQIQNWFTFTTPTQVGIDRGGKITKEQARLFAKTPLTILELPARAMGGTHGDKVTIQQKPSFIIRYYGKPTTDRDLDSREAADITASGISIAVVWQSHVLRCDIAANLTNVNQGFQDALNAFTYAANVIKQPPYTPIYFAVDLNVKATNYDQNCQPEDSLKPIVSIKIPSVPQIISYFRDIKKGYAEYLNIQSNDPTHEPIPYYTGVYAASNVLDACYINGLASYYWQAWPPTWGDSPAMEANLQAWTHANVWQVLLHDSNYPDLWNPNNFARNIAPGGIDLNVSWGDAGRWRF